MTSHTPVPVAFKAVEPEGGASEKPPIIFAHGLTSSKEYWKAIPQNVANATKRRVYVIDARNHGDSEWSDIYDLQCNVDDLLYFMDYIRAPKVILVGHSMGGTTAIKIALRAPQRVEKLIVEDMSVRRAPPEVVGMVQSFMSAMRNAVELVPSGVDEATARKIIAENFIKQIPEESKSIVNPKSMKNSQVALKRTEDGRYTFKANFKALEKALKKRSEIVTEITGVYKGPASFIYGKQSPFPVESDEPTIKKHFPNAQLIGIENATHGVHTDCPKEFTEAVLKFILEE